MSKIDQKYIDNLKQFTAALDGLVEQLQEQSKAGSSDPVNQMLENIPENLSEIVDQQKDILQGQKLIREDTAKILEHIKGTQSKVDGSGIEKIREDTSKILQHVKDIKKKEEKGMFSSITSTDNKKKTVDAVKTIILIAGGVLAIGLAFKIVGKVDFASVVALSLGILLMVHAFKEISDMDVGVTDVLFAGFMMTLIAGSLLASAFILSYMPTMSVEQGLTMLLVADSVGIATWLIMSAVTKEIGRASCRERV